MLLLSTTSTGRRKTKSGLSIRCLGYRLQFPEYGAFSPSSAGRSRSHATLVIMRTLEEITLTAQRTARLWIDCPNWVLAGSLHQR